MRICLDVRYKLASGASTYMKNLVEALLRAKHDHEIVLLEAEGSELDLGRSVERLHCPPGPALRQYLWVQTELPALLRRSGVDLYHSLKHLGPFRADCKQVYSMQSLGGYVSYFSGLYPLPLSEHLYWRYCGRRWVKKLDWLITCASFIGEHISSQFGFPADRITVIPHGRDAFFCPAEHPGAASELEPRPYVLQVANVLPVKNTLTLIEAFAQLAPRHPQLALVICGDQSHRYHRKVVSRIGALGLTERVELRGFVEKSELLLLYRNAAAFVLPSLHEGYGLALLEAMACGSPCVISDCSGLAELGGEAVLRYGAAADASALASAIEAVLTDSSLRTELRDKSRQRAAQYSWDTAAQQTLRVYDRVARREDALSREIQSPLAPRTPG